MVDGDRIVLHGVESAAIESALSRLAQEDILGQLLRREGRMRELGTEAGDVKLDWVDGVEKALQHPEWLAEVEAEAAAIVRQGIRHVIWSGMGGSVQTVYALKGMGYLDSPEMAIFPLDSTDPASLNRLLHALSTREGLTLERPPNPERVRQILAHTLMIGVSMGMTSEEPITHLEWFDGLLQEFQIPNPGAHIQVMTLPGSYLDQFARPRGARMVPIQLDGENHTPGRMSAPATRVFLRPVALMQMARTLAEQPQAAPDGEGLRRVLARAQALYQISHTLSKEERQSLTLSDPWVQLGASIAEEARRGRNKVFLVLPPEWASVAPWVEQLVEESLGKGGKGFLIFYGEPIRPPEQYGEDLLFLQVCPSHLPPPKGEAVKALQDSGKRVWQLVLPVKPVEGVPLGLPEVAALFLGMKITVATFGYLHNIVFVGQPAVEAYKKYARDLRDAPGDVPFGTQPQHTAHFRSLCLFYESLLKKNRILSEELRGTLDRMKGEPSHAADVYAAVLALARQKGRLGYLDFTFNGELSEEARAVFDRARHRLGAECLRVPVKIRTGPSDYHSTEQSETDGPDELVSLRFVALQHEAPLVGRYSNKFLLAQARGTWQAMEDAGRWILMMTFPQWNHETASDLDAFFEHAAQRLRRGFPL